MELDLKEALAVVLDLAEQNAFSEQDCGGDPQLLAESERQTAALEAVRIHLEAM